MIFFRKNAKNYSDTIELSSTDLTLNSKQKLASVAPLLISKLSSSSHGSKVPLTPLPKIDEDENEDENENENKDVDFGKEPSRRGESLTVCKLPDTSHAFSNLVYINPTCYFAGNKYLQIKNYVYETATSELIIHNKTIAMSTIQRNDNNINDEDRVTPIIWKNPTENLDYMQLELTKMLDKPKVAKINEERIIESLKKILLNKIFNLNQKFYFDLSLRSTSSNNSVFTVKKLAVINKTNADDHIDTREVNIGVLTLHTTIEININDTIKSQITLLGIKRRPEFLNPNWQFNSLGIGGLDKEFSVLFRRAFISRCINKQTLKELNIKHVKGVLLYGPPGTGKTLIARQIGSLFKSVEPIVVNGPELMNKYVGESENNLRKLFEPAERDWATNRENSDLHVIIFDEIDAICKARGSTSGGTGVNDSIVNQLLTKMDGVNTPNNFLVIGMTNRKDLLDPALLRPGRLEVHIEINLPDAKGREDILKIHTKSIMESNRLGDDVDLHNIAINTKNYSGAKLEGLIGCATTFALSDLLKGDKVLTEFERSEKFNQVVIHKQDFVKAQGEVTSSFGAEYDNLELRIPHDIILFNNHMEKLYDTISKIVTVFPSGTESIFTMILHGKIGCGKSALAAKFAMESGYPFIKIISSENYIGYSEQNKSLAIAKIFDDAYKSPLSLILIEDVERLLEYVRIGPRFSNNILQCLNICINRIHPTPERRLMVIATTNNLKFLKDVQFSQYFNMIHEIPVLSNKSDFQKVLTYFSDDDITKEIYDEFDRTFKFDDDSVDDMNDTESLIGIGIKKLLNKINIIKQLRKTQTSQVPHISNLHENSDDDHISIKLD